MALHKEKVGWIPLVGHLSHLLSWTGLTTVKLEILTLQPSYQSWLKKSQMFGFAKFDI